MKTILIVGQAHSGYTSVLELLTAAGMRAAKASRREGFLPEDMTKTLCQVEGLVLASEDIQQAQSGKLWQELALDLLLGNVEQPLWGWADPSTIFFLDYWKDADPDIVFLLVYGTPECALAAGLQDVAPVTAQQVTQQAQHWQAYNSALLHFYHRNPNRCMLVHSERTESDPQLVVECVNDHFGLNLRIENQSSLVSKREFDLPSSIARWLVETQPAMANLYEEMQSVANLSGQIVAEDLQAAVVAWNAFGNQSRQRQALAQESDANARLAKEHLAQIERQEKTIRDLSKESERQLLQLRKVQGEVERASNERKTLAQENAINTRLAEERQAQINRQDKTIRDLTEESEMLLLQLHQVQEELERYFLENQKISAPLHVNNQKPTNLLVPGEKHSKAPIGKNAKPLYGAAKRIKRQLTYRLGATMINQSRTLMGWLGMPFAIYKTVRDFKQDKLARGNEMLPPIIKYRDAHEAERVKQHLSYRLGTIMIANSKSLIGWLKMPWLLTSEVRDFKQAKNN